jgi:hypothetical protein
MESRTKRPTLRERMAVLETNMEWMKKQQYLILSMQVSLIVGLIIAILKR